jgi:hypothetical protein
MEPRTRDISVSEVWLDWSIDWIDQKWLQQLIRDILVSEVVGSDRIGFKTAEQVISPHH